MIKVTVLSADEIESLLARYHADYQAYMEEHEDESGENALTTSHLAKAYALAQLAISERNRASKKAKMFDWIVRRFKTAGLQMSGKHHYRLDISKLPAANTAAMAIEEAYDQEMEGRR